MTTRRRLVDHRINIPHKQTPRRGLRRFVLVHAGASLPAPGLEPLASVDDLIDVFDALHDASFLWGDDLAQPDSARLTQLIGLVARQFTVPKA